MLHKILRDDGLPLLLGSGLYGLALGLFLTPYEIVLGGAGGLAVTLRHFLPLPVGVWILLLNLPLLLWAVSVVGLRGMLRTILGVAATSVSTDLLALLPSFHLEPLMAALFGGAVLGAGTGILLPRGFTTGGSDLAAYLWNKQNPRRRLSTTILFIDASIVLGSAAALRNYAGLLHSAAAIASFTASLDAVTRSIGRAKLAVIISRKGEEIGDAVAKKINRGVTILRGLGWYSKEEFPVLLCAVKQRELYTLKELVRSVDGEAFLIVTDASEVLGSGFPNPP
ncbi:MAG: YitT family protein [Clostridia bacterium]|nr:YitT family protein [Clostridia bacterium]